MRSKTRSLRTEIGAPLAVVALYVLTLLLPLHQAAALQRDLARAGYETIGGWTICVPVTDHRAPDSPAAVKCPATGVAKHQLAVTLPPPPSFAPPARRIAGVAYARPAIGTTGKPSPHIGQPRAPPAAA